MNVNTLKAVYFIGAGGIGMSALVRYFLSKGKKVGGYDRTPSELTETLIKEGAAIHYEENVSLIPDDFLNPETTLIVYTPAIPADHKELNYFREHGFEIQKRAQVLGMLIPDCGHSRRPISSRVRGSRPRNCSRVPANSSDSTRCSPAGRDG